MNIYIFAIGLIIFSTFWKILINELEEIEREKELEFELLVIEIENETE